MLSYIKVQDFCNLKEFEIEFLQNESDKTCNQPSLNILVGKNGSGKSCFLDALFEIVSNNLKSDNLEQDATMFKYLIKIQKNSKNYVLCQNIESDNRKIKYITNRKKYLWDKVFRFYTGSTKRQNEDANNNIFDISEKDSKWLLTAYFISNYWKNPKDEKIWCNILKLASDCNLEDNCKEMIKPQVLWIEHILSDTLHEDIIKQKPDFFRQVGTNKIRSYWYIDKIENINNTKPLEIFEKLYNKTASRNKYLNLDLHYTDCGFLYSKGDKHTLYTDQSLSDGEIAVLRRFALLMMLRDENMDVKNPEKYMILLDEPEIYFNETWKTYFIKLIEDIFYNQSVEHDIFIATHSAMLATDIKPNEIHRFYNSEHSGCKVMPNSYNTFAGNIIDISQMLFDLKTGIGIRSKNKIIAALNGIEKYEGPTSKIKEKTMTTKKQKEVIVKLLEEVGPGEWRWKLRSKLNQIEQRENCYYLRDKNNDKNS